jgi:uncharacterized protein (TIGR02145 family)
MKPAFKMTSLVLLIAAAFAGRALVSQAKPKKAAAAGPATVKKNSVPTAAFPECGTVEYGGRTYHTVMIGRQCWLRENLEIGQTVPGSLDQKDDNVVEKYAPGNDAALLREYGGLYQWREYGGYDMSRMAPPVQGICPPGFHIPSESEWNSLISFLGGEALAGGKLKEAGFTHWNGPNSGATNESGFSARGAGIRDADGKMTLFREEAWFWTDTVYFYGETARCLVLRSGSSAVEWRKVRWSTGISVRCLR